MGKIINKETKQQAIERLQDELDDCRRLLVLANQERDNWHAEYDKLLVCNGALFGDYNQVVAVLQKHDVEKMKQLYQSLQSCYAKIGYCGDVGYENCNKNAVLQSQSTAVETSKDTALSTDNQQQEQSAPTKEPPGLPTAFLS
jgi:hypothetical protein